MHIQETVGAVGAHKGEVGTHKGEVGRGRNGPRVEDST